jgi:phosphoribosyl-dephospho-CoA transferase
MIRALVPPPRLSQIVAHMPSAWHAALAQLERRGHALGIVFRVYGSAAWQMLTGLEYVHPASDLDLLWRPRDRTQLDAGVALLEQWQEDTGIAVDGEIVFGDDEAVAWREWRRCGIGEHVLVKRLDGPLLRERKALLGLLSGEVQRAAFAAA